MPFSRFFDKVIRRTRAMPLAGRYAGTVALVAGWAVCRYIIDTMLAQSTPFSLGPMFILLAAMLFDGGAGVLATVLISLHGAYNMAPVGSFEVHRLGDVVSLVNFLLAGIVTALIVETLHHAVEQLRNNQNRHELLLKEFRHRTRNDLQSLVSLLMLRARAAPNRESRDALKQAADHAMALARVHTWLAVSTPGDSYEAMVDTKHFLEGLCHDLWKLTSTDGMRAITIEPCIQSFWLPTERAVQLGLVVNETVTNAIKYAFPGDYGGYIKVKLALDGTEYVLAVCDNGVGIPAENEMRLTNPRATVGGPREPQMGTRLLRGLAAQLRGSFVRRRNDDGHGTLCELRFPVNAPSMMGASAQ